MNSDSSILTGVATILMTIILASIALNKAEETNEVQSCEFGNHHYICAECGEELANRYDAYNK